MGNRLNNKLVAVQEVIREAYENGATLREIAEVHAVSPGTVRNSLRELGVEMRNRGRRKTVKDVDLRRLDVTELPPEVPVDPTPAVQE